MLKVMRLLFTRGGNAHVYRKKKKSTHTHTHKQKQGVRERKKQNGKTTKQMCQRKENSSICSSLSWGICIREEATRVKKKNE
jgi:hypothetical protein